MNAVAAWELVLAPALPPIEARVLREVFRSGSVFQSELATDLKEDRRRVSTALVSLEKRGLVRRVRATATGPGNPSFRVVRTPRARELVHEHLAKVGAAVAAVTAEWEEARE